MKATMPIKTAAIIFTTAFAVAPVLIELLRYFVHNHRERRDGVAGAQDIAIWGTFVAIGCGVLAVVCWGVCYAVR